MNKSNDPFRWIAQAHAEAQQAERTSRFNCCLQTALILVILIALIVIVTTLFEDGSFTILGYIKGCLPWGLCNL